jgi:methylated-DNA-[protein]-cysteine S-methyltransferase
MQETFSIFWEKMRIYFSVIIEDSFVIKSFFSEDPLKQNVKSEKLKHGLELYFKGGRVELDFRYKIDGFTGRVMEVVRKIPYGQTITYGELAEQLETSPRAIGQALKRNPIPVLIPCHRVVARDGIGGYSGGVGIKKALLELEGVCLDSRWRLKE